MSHFDKKYENTKTGFMFLLGLRTPSCFTTEQQYLIMDTLLCQIFAHSCRSMHIFPSITRTRTSYAYTRCCSTLDAVPICPVLHVAHVQRYNIVNLVVKISCTWSTAHWPRNVATCLCVTFFSCFRYLQYMPCGRNNAVPVRHLACNTNDRFGAVLALASASISLWYA